MPDSQVLPLFDVEPGGKTRLAPPQLLRLMSITYSIHSCKEYCIRRSWRPQAAAPRSEGRPGKREVVAVGVDVDHAHQVEKRLHRGLGPEDLGMHRQLLGAGRSAVERSAGPLGGQRAHGLDPGLDVGQEEPDARVLDDGHAAAPAVRPRELSATSNADRMTPAARAPINAPPNDAVTVPRPSPTSPMRLPVGTWTPLRVKRGNRRAMAERVEQPGDLEPFDRPGDQDTASEWRGSGSSPARATTVIRSGPAPSQPVACDTHCFSPSRIHPSRAPLR